MTPLEAVAKAIAKEDWGHGRVGGPWTDDIWDRQIKNYRELLAGDQPDFIKEAHYLDAIFRKARAALNALANIDFPNEMLVKKDGRPYSPNIVDRGLFRSIASVIANSD